MSLRILHIGKYFPPYNGGMENFLSDLVFESANSGIGVAALVHDHSGGCLPQWEELGDPENPIQIIRVPSHGRILYAPISPKFPFYLKKAIAEFRPDIIHMHLPNTSVFWALFSHSAGKIPWVIHWQSDVVPSQIDKRLARLYPTYRLFEQKLLKKARTIIVTSPPYLEASQALALWKKKCRVIPLGLNADKFPVPSQNVLTWAESMWTKTRARILCVGRLSYYKGHEYLIQAISDIPDAQLILVGNGERENKLRRLIGALGVTSRINILSGVERDRLHALYATSDIFCLPSIERTEAFGVVLLEAMAHAKPIIVTAIPGSGVGWVVKNGVNGLTTELNSRTSLAHALKQLIDNTELCRRMGRNGNRRLKEEFDIRQVLTSIQDSYLSARPS